MIYHLHLYVVYFFTTFVMNKVIYKKYKQKWLFA